MMPALTLALTLVADSAGAYALDFQDCEAVHSCKVDAAGDAIAELSNQKREDLKAVCTEGCATQAKKFRKPFYFEITDTKEAGGDVWVSLAIGKTACWLPLSVLKTTKINEGGAGRAVACATGKKAGMLGSHDCQGE